MARFEIMYRISPLDYRGFPRTGECTRIFEADTIEEAYQLCWDQDEYYFEDRTILIEHAVNLDTGETFYPPK